MPVSLIFNQINVNSVSMNSSVTTGQNSQYDWTTQGKYNFGNGQEIGMVFSQGILNVINDCDVSDTPIAQPELNNPQPNVQC
ncbi:hypothetical protein [Priestia koreensis]|uniref:hypothetical protein n=1 Tax=Priestia koreensis TaxID=284581 RepID=UPI001F56723B|nr:hypothetical protein [Priestia koreensis]MCM3006474.1 hypothetical protein [Priestia koreensis]UNL83624.1 hypothetical protein IE339_15815 [Priestia koreensis]